jgi:hypothetical protein
MTFSIYTDSVGGSQVWTETQLAVAVSSSIFNVLLGSVNEIPDSVFNDPVRWLGVQVGADPESTPRQRIAAVGYAFRAAEADTAEYARSAPGGGGGGWVDDGTVVRLETDTDSVGIGTTSPAAKLDVRGTFNVGVNDSGYNVNFYGQYSGSRLFWDENKMALRAGWDSDGTHWAPANVGLESFAAGYNPIASGLASTAMGGITTASANYATAMGYQTLASNLYATAMGQNTTASGPFSTAMGASSIASGNASLATGFMTEASADLTMAMGDHTTASGSYSLAMGQYLTAGPAANSMVLGRGMSNSNRLVNNTTNSLMVGFNDTTATLFVGGPNSRVGVGTSSPVEKLDVDGTVQMTYFKMPTGASDGHVLTSDASGEGTWQAPSPLTDGDWTISGNDMYAAVPGSVGIGTATPATKLDVNGDVNINSAYKIGGSSILSNDGSYNIFLGAGAGANNTGNWNTYLGAEAGYNNTSGEHNTFVGRRTGYSNNTGLRNTFVGDNCGRQNTSGNYNTSIGYAAGYSNTVGDSNVFIGYYAGYGETGSNKLYIANGSDTSDVLVYGNFSNGKVGIGTLSPTKHLHVEGSAKVSDTLFVSGLVGIGTAAPQGRLHVHTTSFADTAIYAEGAIGVYGKGYIGVPGFSGIGVKGETPDGNASGRLGYFLGNPYNYGVGVYGSAVGDDYAGKFVGKVAMNQFQLTALPSDGYVLTSDASGNGSWQAPGDISLPYSDTDSNQGTLFTITNTDSGGAIKGENNEGSHHTFGLLGALKDGVYAWTEATNGAAIYGIAKFLGFCGYYFQETKDRLIYLGGDAAVYAENGADSLYCRLSDLQYAMHAWGTDIFETVAQIGGGLWVLGDILKGKSITTVDHPLDPENMLLNHASMESPEALAVYRGKAKLNGAGETIVQLPDYFAAFTKENEATVTLTPVGRPFLTGYDWQSGHQDFKIYGQANREVSWVVYSERDDPYMRMSTWRVEEQKGSDSICDRGKFLHPTAYGHPRSMGFDYEKRQQAMQEASPEKMKRDIQLSSARR